MPAHGSEMSLWQKVAFAVQLYLPWLTIAWWLVWVFASNGFFLLHVLLLGPVVAAVGWIPSRGFGEADEAVHPRVRLAYEVVAVLGLAFAVATPLTLGAGTPPMSGAGYPFGQLVAEMVCIFGMAATWAVALVLSKTFRSPRPRIPSS